MMQLYNVFLLAVNHEVLIFSIGFAIIAISLSLMSLVLELVSKFYRIGRRGKILQIVDILKIAGVSFSLLAVISYLIGTANNIFIVI
ncbi:hypothetical protein [Thomasclavelia ramosa]|uniref:hypothetical protein n=1 Tax=Thomasclavelia ramosa TaxID=1547 RepID=UPI0034AD6AB4